ncbi:cytochrome p450 [Phlyctema vagabunda]|uniref:Cytochrome p450 n=1 Tax=Phlyctema vagabunda TaxID=108571 RepID=A0ABR4PB40_9HELO
MDSPLHSPLFVVNFPISWASASYAFTTVLICSLIIATLYVAGHIIYQVTFHPLARYPGPFLAKFTDARAGYHAWLGDTHLDMWRCHEKYGPYVRYTPERLLINTAGALKEAQDKHRNVTKAREYLGMVHRTPSTFTLLDKKEHAKKRRILSQGFSDSAVRAFEQSILDHVEKFCATMAPSPSHASSGQGWSQPVNISTWCSYLFFDMITDLVFGTSYNMLGAATYRYVIDAIKASNQRVSVIIQAPGITFRRLDKKLFPRAILARNQFLHFMKKVVTDRMAAKVDSKNVFANLAVARDPETNQGFTMLELGAESISLLVAGSDTTSTFVSGLFFYLSRHRDVYERAVSEVRAAFADASEVRLGPKLNSCRYLRACLDETLRLSPPVGAALFREALQGGAVVDGLYIPEGMRVGTSIYAIHHNPIYFPEPFAFRPERWLNRTSPVIEAYAPFSLGARGCVGKGLALMEAMLMMATVLYKFDFQTAPGTLEGGGDLSAPMYGRHRPNEFQLKEHVTSDCSGPMLRFRFRDEVVAEQQATVELVQ